MGVFFQNHTKTFNYCVVCLSSFLLDLVIIFILVSFFKVNYLIAVVIGFIIAVFVNYVGNRFWTFSTTLPYFWNGFAKTMVVWFSILGIVTTTMYILVEGLGLHYLFARLVAALISAFVGYLLDSRWSFGLGRF